MTNLEKILSTVNPMRLARFIVMNEMNDCKTCPVKNCDNKKPCELNIRDWLKKEAEEE